MRNNPIYCSTGVFVGRINNRDHTLISRFGSKIKADGFELLIMSVWYEKLRTILHDLMLSDLHFPVLHADKGIGDSLSFADKNSFYSAIDLMKINCEAAAYLGAEKIVVHPWGIPKSDEHFSYICEYMGSILNIAKEYNLSLLLENCCCIHNSPFENLKRICSQYPDIKVIIDTRPAQFHRELSTICQDTSFLHNKVEHIHINDYHGGLKQWEALQPILHPGKGDVDFKQFFDGLKKVSYSGSITLEAPSMREDHVAIDEINNNLSFIRNGISL